MRRQPRQARSRETVGVIVEAAARVLARNGWSGFSTNAVAAKAGVSIGSLYQYFPDKLALLEAIRLRHFGDVLGALRNTETAADLRTRLSGLVDGLIAAHDGRAGLHRVLMEEVPNAAPPSAEEIRFDEDYGTGFRRVVAAASGRLDELSLTIRAAVLAAAVEGLVHEWTRRPAHERAAFRSEIVALVESYLHATR